MQLSNAHAAYVPLRKLTDYLLSETHTVGRAKARFFHGIGFSKEQADELRQALLEVAATGKVEQIVETSYGTKYIVDGKLFTPLGKRVSIRTVWIVEKGKGKINHES